MAVPQPFAPPSAPHPPAPETHAQMQLAPVAESRSTRRPLLVLLCLVAVLAVSLGAFFLISGRSSDEVVEETPDLVTDPTPDDSASYSFSAATAKTEQAGSISMDMMVQSPEGDISMVATIDRATGRMAFDVDLQGVDIGDELIEVPSSFKIVVDEQSGVVYVNSDFYATFFPVETSWVSNPVQDATGEPGDSIEDMFANPFDLTSLFGDGIVTEVGPETIDGAELVRFRVTFDADALLALEPGAFDGFGDIGQLDEVTYDVWVSEDNLIRRIAFDLPDAIADVGFVMNIDISDEAIQIDLPATDDVTDINELFSAWEDIDILQDGQAVPTGD
jgi:hypothetical protein